ncbi:tail fiber protein [Escherichia coli]|uniref:tail fiber protein n=2 Tax=Escherichia coli TaxID=562 RepID=UPI000B7F22F5|nr:phage tail protein [Escherichia coli]ECR6810391.1 phage tail protein [Salmonella enterica]EEC9971280.1 phage tail protein [Escherichia coli]EES2106260.1 phage tail protein [Escherichia coli]EET9587546.1 phage tail protein [Escherichia coli]EFC2937472.1 phage tail protein [Escherichia coli]
MNDVTVVTSVTYPSPESLALVADVQYHEPYLSAALNRKFRGIVDPGFYAGFLPKPGGGMNLLITSVDGDKTAGAASVDIGEFYQVTIQHRKDISLALSAGKKYAIVLKGRYLLGEDTYQVNTASHIHAAEFIARTYTDSYQLGDGELLVCTVNIPAGVSAITQEMIDTSERINRTIGIDISDSVTSTRSDVAASSLAVKKAYDLAKSKYTAQDASTTQKGLVQLSSATNSDSETMAATPKAVKSIKDLADTKAPIESPSLTGTPTAPTAAQGTNSTQIANTAFVKAAITALINGAPGTLDTLKEIAAAINNDPNYSTTINNALALKAPLASPALTGVPTAPTAAQGTNNTQIATTAYVRAAISALVGSSPEALDTLNELAAALGNDPNFATTMTNALAGKQPLDATLTALAGLATGANKLPYFTGTDTVSQTDLTSVGRDILAKTSVLAVIQYLGLRELGTSGEKIPLLSTANTWSARQTFNGGITGALTGNADTATKLKTARTIGGVSFDGSANIDLPGVNKTGNQNTTGNAATATKLQTARTINGVSFDGSKNIELTAENLNLERTVELAAGSLQKNQNGADIPGKDTFTKNIGACRAFHSSISTGAGNWTTAQLIEWLDSQGAFNHPYWMCKCSWSYGNNKIITDTGCGTIHLAGCVIEVMGNKGAMTIRVTTPSTSSGGGITNAQFTYINHGDAYAPGWRRDYNTKNQQPAFALGQTGRRVANDKAVGWNWNSGVYDADISGASTLILHFNMNAGSCPAVQFRVNYRNGGIFYRSARDGYGFEANWSEFYTTTRKPSAGDVGAYTQAECNSRFITGIRLGGLSSVQTWNGPGWSDRSGYVVTGSVNGNRDELIDTTQARPIQYCINGTWYNAGSI